MSTEQKNLAKKPIFDTMQLAGLILAVVALVVMYLIPESEALTRAGINTIGVLVATICLLICRTFPVATIGILLVPMLCQRRFEIVRKRRRNFVIFRRRE